MKTGHCFFAVLAVSAVGLSACGSDAASTAPTAAAPLPTRIIVGGIGTTEIVGTTMQLSTSVMYSDGLIKLLSPGRASWESSNPAVVTVATTGLATVTGPGQASVKADYKGVTGGAVFTGRQPNLLDYVGVWRGTYENLGCEPPCPLLYAPNSNPLTLTLTRTGSEVTGSLIGLWGGAPGLPVSARTDVLGRLVVAGRMIFATPCDEGGPLGRFSLDLWTTSFDRSVTEMRGEFRRTITQKWFSCSYGATYTFGGRILGLQRVPG